MTEPMPGEATASISSATQNPVLLLPFILMLLPFLAVGVRAQEDGFDPKFVPEAPLHERVLNLPGDPLRPVQLQVTMYTPPGPGPFPLAVLNHGASHVSAGNRGSRYRYTYSAYYFLSRGFAVAMPMARGFADSGGTLVHLGCALDRVGLANAHDLRGVIDALSREPDIDPDKIIVAGQSFGGWTTMAFGTLGMPGVRGLIGFSPALRASDCHSQDSAMIDAMRGFGAEAKLPSLWFYGDNDSVMPIGTWRAVFNAYEAASGRAELVAIGPFMEDSHQMLTFPESLPIWTPKVDAFLARIGLSSAERYPEYLPLPVPPPSHAAALDDLSAIPSVNDKGRAAYRDFLSRKRPRVFVLASNGSTIVTNGGFDPLSRALAACRKIGLTCKPYAIDDEVVWTGGLEEKSTYHRTVRAGISSVLDFAFAVNPDCSSRGLPKLWVSQAPEHGTAEVSNRDGHPGFPQGNPYASCNASLVPGVLVTYTSAPGFTGLDAMTFEETDVDGRHHVFRMALTVP